MYFLASIALFLYSYTQVDLNLTLSRVGFVQTVQKAFQSIGFFNRPLSAGLYLGILLLWFSLYGWTIWKGYKKKLTNAGVWHTIVLVTAILAFSYPAFSYDMFNYLFTAKTILLYHKNPYEVIPLQFTGIEPWLNFMRWTHLPSAYTPLWIGATLPFYLLGFGYLLTILFSMKLLIAGLYLGACWFLYKSLQLLDSKHTALGLAIFALNPLVVIESLVSAHNDIGMMTFAMASLYLFLKRNHLASFVTLAISAAIKLMTVVLFPVLLVGWNRTIALLFMVIGFVLVIMRREVLPWYWVWVMPFVGLLPQSTDITIVASGVSMGLLLRYAPYLYLGHWDAPVPTWKWWLTFVPIFMSVMWVLLRRRRIMLP